MYKFEIKECGCHKWIDKRIYYGVVYVYCQSHMPTIEQMEYDYDNPGHALEEPADYFELVPTPKRFIKA